jgi:hypothetical protein
VKSWPQTQGTPRLASPQIDTLCADVRELLGPLQIMLDRAHAAQNRADLIAALRSSRSCFAESRGYRLSEDAIVELFNHAWHLHKSCENGDAA